MILRKVGLIVTLALSIFAAPLPADAQQAGKVYRIGYLSAPTRKSVEHILQVFLRRLRELGWVEGQNIVIEYRWAEGKYDRLPDLAAELVRLKVDVIVTPASVAALAAQKATSSIPIVMLLVADPVAEGLVRSLARPGGNITGTTNSPGFEIAGKQLQLLKEAVPQASRVAILWNPANTHNPPMLREAETAARSLNVQLQLLAARGPEEFDGAFAAMTRERADALLVLRDSMFLIHRTRLAELAAKHRLPAMHGYRESVEVGGLMAYGANMAAVVLRGATYVDKILKGTKPADLPVEEPTKFELLINLKTAKALGLTIPQSLFILADQLIQ